MSNPSIFSFEQDSQPVNYSPDALICNLLNLHAIQSFACHSGCYLVNPPEGVPQNIPPVAVYKRDGKTLVVFCTWALMNLYKDKWHIPAEAVVGYLKPYELLKNTMYAPVTGVPFFLPLRQQPCYLAIVNPKIPPYAQFELRV